jgi:signal transduction histidine kinase
MRLSIYVRTVLILNIFVLGLAAVLGWVAQDTAGQVVEERLVKEMVVRVSGFLRDKRLPLSDAMMKNLRDIFSAEWVATTGDGAEVVGSSLPESKTQEFRREIATMGEAGILRLDGVSYRMDFVDLALTDPGTGRAGRYRLFMLADDAQFSETRSKAATRVAGVVLPAVLAATLLAVFFAWTITRPIRKLAAEMDQVGTSGAEIGRHTHRGPAEIEQLAKSFHRLLGRLEGARERLAQSERLAGLGKVSLSVVHELRNPLSAIKMNMRILKDSMKSSAGAAEAAAILREIERMELYLNELMSVSVTGESTASQWGRPQVPAKLSELADNVLEILSGRCAHANVRIARDYPAPEPSVPVDADPIRQVIMNLAVNAIEAMPAGGEMKVTIRVQRESIVLSIADTGRGVQSAHGKDIFDAFVSTKPNGTGLGLYLSRRIVAAHGGRIGYESSPAGATFWFEIPLSAKADDGSPEFHPDH